MLVYSATGKVRERMGNNNPKVVPAADYDTADGKRISIHAGTETLLRRLARVIGRPGLAVEPAFRDFASRVANQDELYAIISEWVGRTTLADAMEALVAADIPASPLMSVADIAADPHFRERGTLIDVEDEEYGRLTMAAPIPRMSETPGSIRSLGPALGSANEAVLGGMLGLEKAEIEALRKAGVI
jgi:crotonobetainyl-CoA:carnitine CoA-transferase CaiB-like acyl-CoA transferase